jgi:ribonuclease J
MTAIQYGRNIIVIDCGGMFPDAEHLGVDLIIPDFSWVVEHKDMVRAVLVTHGHEDHIGALPYLLAEVDAPVYATPLTRGLIEVKLKEEGGLGHVKIETIAPRQPFQIGPFGIEAFHVNHSIPDAVGYAIQTPQGMIVYTGDFKIDYTPVDGWPTDFAKLVELGDRGVLALLSDSTGAENAGPTPSEAVVGETFKRLFGEIQGRIIVATFGSLIARVQQVIDAAALHGRVVMPAGRSMVDNIEMALELGYLKAPEGVLRGLGERSQVPYERTVIVATGSQGEPSSAVARMAEGRHRDIDIEAGDTDIFSSHPIPGNEQAVATIINKLFEKGANVIYGSQAQVHVSGHGGQDDQKMMLNLVRPKYFIPIHGEARHLVLHARHAEAMGIARENICIARNGKGNHRFETTREVLTRFLTEETGRRPMILPVVVEH